MTNKKETFREAFLTAEYALSNFTGISSIHEEYLTIYLKKDEKEIEKLVSFLEKLEYQLQAFRKIFT
ncbi:MAG: hypothetical protein FWC11_01485 [Firmicutes bacterium]|nr:hypothetical protein [Bacillota bacterium]